MSNIALVTFDVFAALMDTPNSLISSVATILPRLSPSAVNSLVDQWLNDYSNYAGYVFDESITGPSPFQWVIRSSLSNMNSSMNLQLSTEETERLILAWGKLTPWPGTYDVLAKISNSSSIALAPLSNGDVGTLNAAMAVFQPHTIPKFLFSSDFPIGAFKPDSAMYKQLLADHGVTVEQVLHVAGSPTDAQGARKAGLFSALVYNKPIPGVYAPCFSLKNITDLLPVLGL